MKIKVLSRNPNDYLRETKKDISKIQRNYDTDLHPFETSREYIRSLNAVKLERVFAKPFLGSLEGHRDSIQCLIKHRTQLSLVLSGSCDGDIKIWNLPKRECVATIRAHNGFVRGLSVIPDGNAFYSVGNDKLIKRWTFDKYDESTMTIVGKHIFTSIDHHYKKSEFATSGETVELWDENRAQPTQSFKWGVDSHSSVKFNPIETTVLASCAADRSILLYDTRQSVPLRKVILSMNSNTVAWNPMEAFVFTAANEDYNLYSFDMRNLKQPFNIHKDHVAAVIDIDYSPTGKEFVAGSFDKTIRIFPVDKGHSREIYHTKRMQHLTCVQWSLDNKYIISGSDEMCLRLWKAKASEKLGVIRNRESEALEYNEALKEKFSNFPKIKRIARHRHLPRSVYFAKKEHQVIHESQKRKEANARANSKPGSIPYVAERAKLVVEELE
ncbi:unnamed protein product [Didymodactylos carnosus]|uniref:DDB1- and CUL4-associated factor 13 n=1 Tax=Didymodactylos carnosus TaxID=1234261 RepID=A0A813Y6Z7_9BILA|nr:unnamed protein product [Didymodactylos carnosus]CAF0877864.1 unnamed protein product [Didymodactylos carnosus]CAF3515750.1 unnamed protein product [Didymodactylos carnosus]CAF3664477.1 unnamed protein product [Didymodactylos carnosus]